MYTLDRYRDNCYNRLRQRKKTPCDITHGSEQFPMRSNQIVWQLANAASALQIKVISAIEMVQRNRHN